MQSSIRDRFRFLCLSIRCMYPPSREFLPVLDRYYPVARG